MRTQHDGRTYEPTDSCTYILTYMYTDKTGRKTERKKTLTDERAL